MTIAITTPTGNIGNSVTQQLFTTGEPLVLLTRTPEKLDESVRQAAEVRIGSLDDLNFVVQATQGVDALFWLTPYNFATDNLRQWQQQLGKGAAAAVQKNSIAHVVNLSSNGAHLPEGMGPISGLYAVEQVLNQTGANIVHLRPGFFMENYLWQLDSLRTEGKVFMPTPNDRRMAMIATQDIANVAAKWLSDRSWSGQIVQGLHGAADLSFDEAADILSQVLNKPITHAQITPEQFRQALLNQGATADVANQYSEMWQALSHQDYAPAEPRTEATTTPTTFVSFVRDRLLSLL